ncbi:MAG TPA: class I SAM-dependent methyltransferase [Candidatus Binatia bacterium]|nr:class I SAM-dependent methyltransferase [Candidatus Binatia bacterium]
MPVDAASPRLSVIRSASAWWKDLAHRQGAFQATRQLVAMIWEFLRDSTPERRRMAFGDAEYDWQHRVNTTSGAVGWRDRLLGVFHSAYQPTDEALFHEMMRALLAHAGSFAGFVFIDIGSGKGRTLLMAADYPFRRIVGVELLPDLHGIARENIAAYHGERQKCAAIESLCADAADFFFPEEPLVIYLFNPLPEAGLKRLLANLQRSLKEHPRGAYVLYHNPLLEHVVREAGTFQKVGGTEQYAIYGTLAHA